MKRDRLTIGMLLGIPLMQLILFGFAINMNPRHLPTALVVLDHSPQTRDFVTALENTKYFDIKVANTSEAEAERLLARGTVTFIVRIPAGFTRSMIRGENPSMMVVADATDPAATGNAIAALNTLADTVFNQSFNYDGLNYLHTNSPPFDLLIHSKYNPEAKTQYNIVPGLMGVILTMTMVMITGMAITRERELGTMENLLASPVRPIEVMLGKILPYIIVGYVQQILILLAAIYVFNVPIYGSFWLLSAMTLPFLIANLTVGLTFSAVAQTQLQAMQMTFFFFLPSILLSGFMFPFYGMPDWAQYLGELLPLTHYLRIVRGIILKGNDFIAIWQDLWPMLLFILIVGFICLKRYRQTLE